MAKKNKKNRQNQAQTQGQNKQTQTNAVINKVQQAQIAAFDAYLMKNYGFTQKFMYSRFDAQYVDPILDQAWAWYQYEKNNQEIYSGLDEIRNADKIAAQKEAEAKKKAQQDVEAKRIEKAKKAAARKAEIDAKIRSYAVLTIYVGLPIAVAMISLFSKLAR